MPTSYAQKRSVRKYDEKNTVQLHLKLNRTTDADILRKLGSIPNMQGYIKTLIRADIQK